jgi:hypothetical protein
VFVFPAINPYRFQIAFANDKRVFAKALADAAATTLTRPEVNAAVAIEQWQADTHDVNALVTELSRQVEAVNGGDMRRAEANADLSGSYP